MFKRIMEYFGYHKLDNINDMQEQISELFNMYTEQSDELDGLIYSIGQLERRHRDENLIISSLITLSGEEEITLKREFLAEMTSKPQETFFEETKDGDLKCVVKLTPQE